MASSFRREVVPKVIETLGAAKQSREDCQVREQDVPGPLPRGWHPEKRIEIRVARLDERMRSGQINRLPGKNANCARIFRRQRIVRQMLMEIEGCHVRKPAMGVEITHCRERGDLVGAVDDCWTKTEAVLHRYSEALHE